MFDFLFIVKWYFFGRLKIGRKSRKKKAFAEFNRALSNLNKGSYVIDCGANVGEFTKLFLEKGFFVDAFEPDPIAIEELKKKCKNNKNLKCLYDAYIRAYEEIRLKLPLKYTHDLTNGSYWMFKAKDKLKNFLPDGFKNFIKKINANV